MTGSIKGLGWIAAIALLAGCEATIPEGILGCDANDECPDGWVCGGNARCYSTQERADQATAGSNDGGAGARDAGGGDAGGRHDGGDSGDAGSTRDAAAGSDAGLDAGSANDAGVDGGSDAGANPDAGTDAGADAGVGGPAASVVATAVAQRICNAISYCESKNGALLTELTATWACHPKAGSEDEFQRLMAAVQDGRIAYDATAAAQCLTSLENSAFDCRRGGAPIPAACEQVLQGQLAADDPCSLRDECQPPLTCLGADLTCGGSCQAPGTQGSPCNGERDCAANFVCLDAVCDRRAGANGSCTDDRQCPVDQFCTPSSARCEALPGEGAPCAALLGPSSCADDLVCAIGVAGTPDICRVGGAEGASCSQQQPCRVGTRCLTDDATGGTRCVRIAETGKSCSGHDCPFGMFCNQAERLCQPRPVVGEPCSDACGSGDPSQDCATCIEGICQNGSCEFAATGAFCRDTLGLPFGTCRGFCNVQQGTCEDRRPEGSGCNQDAECENGLVCVGAPNPACTRIACQ